MTMPIFLKKITAAQNEVTLTYHRLRGLYFVAVVFAATIMTLLLQKLFCVSIILHAVGKINISNIYDLFIRCVYYCGNMTQDPRSIRKQNIRINLIFIYTLTKSMYAIDYKHLNIMMRDTERERQIDTEGERVLEREKSVSNLAV